ncbi:hypothetical protein [Vreelandella sp. GE22]
MAHGLIDPAAQAVVAIGGIDRTAPLACAGEPDQAIGSIVTECQADAVGGLLFDHVARAVEAVAGAVQVVEAVVGQRLLAVQAAPGFPVQGVRLQVDFQVQPRGAQPVQVAAAVGVPVERGQLAKLALLRGDVGGNLNKVFN